MGNDESHFTVSLMINCEGQSHKTVSTNHKLSEEKGDPKWNRAEALLLTSLTPYRWATPAHRPLSVQRSKALVAATKHQ